MESFHLCPNCGIGLYIEQLNCGIFRCAALTTGYVPPHASKDEIDQWRENGLLQWGCGMPLRWNDGVLEICRDANGEIEYA